MWATRDREIDVMVTGVYKDYPSNSHFKPKYILNVNAMRAIHGDHFNDYMEGSRFGEHMEFFDDYIILKPEADIKPIKAELDKIAKQMTDADSFARAQGWTFSSSLTKVSDLHFDKANAW